MEVLNAYKEAFLHLPKGIDAAEQKGAKIIVFPELCLTGYTCQDLFLQEESPGI